MTDELRIGVIGVGGRGTLVRQAHRPDEGVRVVAGADVYDEALDGFREYFGPEVFVTRDWREVVQDGRLDAVIIATPDYLHEEHAVGALESGVAVYLEKPMAITVAGCDRILEAARRSGAKLYLGHNMRHMAFVRRMKELIDEGAIGEVKTAWCRHFVSYGGDAFFKDWHSERRYVNGLLLQKACHDIDVLHWLCGGYTRCVNAMGDLVLYDRVTDRRDPEEPGDPTFRTEHWPPLAQTRLSPVINVEDVSMMQMLLDNGVLCAYQQCHFTPDGWRNYTVIGTEGRIENLGDDPPNCTLRIWNRRGGFNETGDAAYPMEADPGTHGGADTHIVDEFIRFVRDGGATVTSPVAARNSVAAGCAATESLRNGGVPCEVPRADPDDMACFGEGIGRRPSPLRAP